LVIGYWLLVIGYWLLVIGKSTKYGVQGTMAKWVEIIPE
jgi:hypothetical protein